LRRRGASLSLSHLCAGSFPIIEANADRLLAAMKGHATKVIVLEKGKPIHD